MATRRFCQKFLTRDLGPTGRQYDQMTQSARSGKANIVESSARSSTSKKTEIKLTDVARASLAELQSDYEDRLLDHGQAPWHRDSAETRQIYAIRLDPPHYGNDFVHNSCKHILAQRKKNATWLELPPPPPPPPKTSPSPPPIFSFLFAFPEQTAKLPVSPPTFTNA